MVARRSFLRLLLALVSASSLGAIAAADPPLSLTSYRFITSKSLLDVRTSDGTADMQLNILGHFGLVTGWNEEVDPTAHVPRLDPFAQFTDVDAILFDPRRATPLPTPGWDLDKTLGLSGLTGTFTQPDDLFFLGADGHGQAIRLEAKVTGPLLHLTGGSTDPCCNDDLYSVDAWAHQLPWADFNGNGAVDAGDYAMWRQDYGATVKQGGEGDANGDGIANAADYTIWRNQLGQTDGMSSLAPGQVPEPATICLLIIGMFVSLAQYPRSRRKG